MREFEPQIFQCEKTGILIETNSNVLRIQVFIILENLWQTRL